MGSWCSTTCPPRISRGAPASWPGWGTRATASAAAPQIIYGLLCDKPGRPIAVEVFSGELHDDKTLPSQIREAQGAVRALAGGGRLRPRDGHQGQPRADARGEGTGWITALKAPQIEKLVSDGALQLSLFDQTNLAEITSEDYPGERLIVCRNPLVAAERARKREELLHATERGLAEIAQRVERGTLHGADQIGLAVGPALKRYRVKKHFEVQITDTTFTYQRKTEQIEAEAALDGIYVLRTSVTDTELATGEVVRSYKHLEQVERAFRPSKDPSFEIRPIHHHLEDRVRAHVFLCMLAYYLTWHLRHAWAPLLFKDETPPAQPDPVAKATRSRRRAAQGADQTHHHRRALPQLQEPARRTRDPHPQHHPPPRHHRHLQQARPTHHPPSPRARPRRDTPRSTRSHHPSTPEHPQPNNGGNPLTRTGNFGTSAPRAQTRAPTSQYLRPGRHLPRTDVGGQWLGATRPWRAPPPSSRDLMRCPSQPSPVAPPREPEAHRNLLRVQR